jgi:hypothetical protein
MNQFRAMSPELPAVSTDTRRRLAARIADSLYLNCCKKRTSPWKNN